MESIKERFARRSSEYRLEYIKKHGGIRVANPEKVIEKMKRFFDVELIIVDDIYIKLKSNKPKNKSY